MIDLIIFYIKMKVINFIQNIVSNNNDIATSYSTGKTFENRDLRVLVLKTSTSQKSIWIGKNSKDHLLKIVQLDY